MIAKIIKTIAITKKVDKTFFNREPSVLVRTSGYTIQKVAIARYVTMMDFPLCPQYLLNQYYINLVLMGALKHRDLE